MLNYKTLISVIFNICETDHGNMTEKLKTYLKKTVQLSPFSPQISHGLTLKGICIYAVKADDKMHPIVARHGFVSFGKRNFL